MLEDDGEDSDCLFGESVESIKIVESCIKVTVEAYLFKNETSSILFEEEGEWEGEEWRAWT